MRPSSNPSAARRKRKNRMSMIIRINDEEINAVKSLTTDARALNTSNEQHLATTSVQGAACLHGGLKLRSTAWHLLSSMVLSPLISDRFSRALLLD
jgi:hypothetical protein